jgi:hypothetical protein
VCVMRRIAVTLADNPSSPNATTTGTNGGSRPWPNKVSTIGDSPLITPK